ncbi:unnamed protein product [Clavelina lepadiformis]|uniref:GTP-binding protein Di-Ras2 n=1 Tax=Clavelina lepadiformis TaxID=159417 RepID=A0ABP0G427_CLALP
MFFKTWKIVNSDKNVCTLQITDTAGSHPFPAMQRLSISRGHAFVLVYSITSKQSIEELKPIYDQILQLKTDLHNVPICLVGNKCDETERNVTAKEGKDLATFWKCGFLETSAKNNLNVKELFQKLLELEKRQNLTLNDDACSSKKNKSAKRKEQLRGKCVIH